MFLNCTAHSLNPRQVKKALELSANIAELKTIKPSLHERLINCPSTEIEQIDLAYELFDEILVQKEKCKEDLYVHLPVGSPFFMTVFIHYFPKDKKGIHFVFSHSKRDSEEVQLLDGSTEKKSLFVFEKFLVLNRN
ncbi:MAG: hypothetical protein H7A25_25275 [Leptospiraceae bacterium]|nr:hypothetical protein [Leptospiraceae bacterium]MCP5503234.1 hypothetical protein [Leptospiraceae bacterium]